MESSLDAAFGQDTPDLFHGFLRSYIVRSYKKDDVIDKLEGVIQHQALHLAIVNSAPVRTSQKGPADLEFGFGRSVQVIPGSADNPPVFRSTATRAPQDCNASSKYSLNRSSL